MSLYSQLGDYIDGLRSYIHTATGIATNRIIFSTPDIAKRRILQELNDKNTATLTKTIEVDNFISFYFPFVQDQISTRSNVAQGFYGGKAMSQRKVGWNINLDVPVQIEIWGGPTQEGKAFVFNAQMMLKDYMRRMQGVPVLFTDPTDSTHLLPDPNLVTKDPVHPTIPYDANNFYLFLLEGSVDNSQPQEQYNQGALYRATFEFNWMVTFYNIPSQTPIGTIQEIVIEYEATAGDLDRVEVDVVAP